MEVRRTVCRIDWKNGIFGCFGVNVRQNWPVAARYKAPGRKPRRELCVCGRPSVGASLNHGSKWKSRLIDGERIHRVRPVREDQTGHSRVSVDSWPEDRETIFPLQAAAGYAMVRGLFQHKKNVLTEG